MKNLSITELNKNETKEISGGLGWWQTAACTAFCGTSAAVSITGPMGFVVCMSICLEALK